ncbi:MAG: hypothetical protein ACE5HE_10615 [Phycisphaerae bacterium]
MSKTIRLIQQRERRQTEAGIALARLSADSYDMMLALERLEQATREHAWHLKTFGAVRRLWVRVLSTVLRNDKPRPNYDDRSQPRWPRGRWKAKT